LVEPTEKSEPTDGDSEQEEIVGSTESVEFVEEAESVGSASAGMQWCVLRVASNREIQVRDVLERKIRIEGLGDEIGRILVPTERVKRVRGTQQRVYERKLYPGYVFMEMRLNDDGGIYERSWFMIKEMAGVGDFIGTEGKPSPMSDADVNKIVHQSEKPEETPAIQMEFKKGDQIKIKGGSFEGFEGTVEKIDSEKGTIRVIVTIFGREAPLDIEYWQIEKV